MSIIFAIYLFFARHLFTQNRKFVLSSLSTGKFHVKIFAFYFYTNKRIKFLLVADGYQRKYGAKMQIMKKCRTNTKLHKSEWLANDLLIGLWKITAITRFLLQLCFLFGSMLRYAIFLCFREISLLCDKLQLIFACDEC